MNDRDARIIQMAKELTPPREIAVALEMPKEAVHNVLCNARRRGEQVPHFKAPPKRTITSPEPPKPIVIGLRLHRLLEFAAEKRGVSPNDLARDLIEAALLRKVARDG